MPAAAASPVQAMAAARLVTTRTRKVAATLVMVLAVVIMASLSVMARVT